MCWFFSKEKREQARMKKEGKRLLKQKAKEEEKARKLREKEEKKKEKEETAQSPCEVTELEITEQEVTEQESPQVENSQEDAVTTRVEKPKPRPANYHVSFRDDGRWQVKKAKGERAIKIFMTQAEAIAFAKERAESMDGSITIHKKDGKIRKQKYAKVKKPQNDETNE